MTIEISLVGFIIILTIIFGFIWVSNTNKTKNNKSIKIKEPTFLFLEKVKIVDGFYRGHKGTIVNVRSFPLTHGRIIEYLIIIENCSYNNITKKIKGDIKSWINNKNLEKF